MNESTYGRQRLGPGDSILKTMILRRIGVLSFAKLYGAMCVFLGLIFGLIYGTVTIISGMVASQQPALGIVGGLLMMVLIPVLYGIFGFASGAISAYLYNLVAGRVGGLEMELEASQTI